MICSTVNGTSIRKILAEANSRPDVIPQAEDGRATVRRVGPDALEHARAVVHRVREHVHGGVVPVDELAVHPDLLGRGDGHGGYSLSAMASPTAEVDSCSVVVDMESDWAASALSMRAAASASPRCSSMSASRVDGGQRIGDTLPRDVMGGTVDGLEEGRTGPGRVQVGRGGEADATAYRSGQVGEDVTEEVVGHDHVIALRLLDQVDARSVHMVVVPGDVRVVSRDLRNRALPEIAGEGQHVGLVDQRQLVAPARGQVEGEPGAALGSHPGVDGALRGHLVGCALAEKSTLTGVRALGVLADDRKVGTLGDGARHALEGAQVDEEVELEAQAQEQTSLQRARRHRRVTDGRADRAQEDRLEPAQLGQRLVGAGPPRRGGSGLHRGRTPWCPGRPRRHGPP